MVAEPIGHIGVYHAEKQNGVTTQHITIYYNCIGTFSVLDRRKIPFAEITMGTRKGVAVSYSRSGLPYRILSKNNAECPTRILKSYKDTPHGPSVHNDTPANPHKIKVFW